MPESPLNVIDSQFTDLRTSKALFSKVYKSLIFSMLCSKFE
jgi:hypothetical protein